jgi:hypothetical protein
VKFSRGIKFLYLFALISFIFVFFKFKAKPKLKEIYLTHRNLESNKSDQIIKKNNLNSLDNRVNVGKSFLINDNKYWYQVIQLSFWRREYLQLNTIEKKLEINNVKIKKYSNNNFAFGTVKNKNVTYACMQNATKFNYNFSPEENISAYDLDYWKRVILRNLNFIFYSFKPNNYECLLVITPNLDFFKSPESEMKNIIFEKFNYD